MAELQDVRTLMVTAAGQIGTKEGTVLRVRSKGEGLEVTVDWETFVEYFDGQKPDYRLRGFVGRTVSGIMWQAQDPRAHADLDYTIGPA